VVFEHAQKFFTVDSLLASSHWSETGGKFLTFLNKIKMREKIDKKR